MPPPSLPSKTLQARFAALGQEVRTLCGRAEFARALTVAEQALAMAPGHPRVLGDIALCRMRLGQVDLARQAYLQSLRADPEDVNVLDGLSEACGLLGLTDETRQYGRAALTLKAAQVAGQPAWPLPDRAPPEFHASQPGANVIAFSLFGGKPRYCETAVLNVHEARRLLPGWTCRFYCDESVPLAVRQRLSAAGAEVVMVAPDDARDISGLMWRFFVLDDPQVHRYLLRDADSLISTREVGAVNAWLESGLWFHLMRDWTTHSELLLAGMWGGCGGVFHQVRQSLRAYMKEPPRLGARLVDQHWLRAHVWPTVCQSVLQHDGVFGFMDAQPFPPHQPSGMGEAFHVGSNFAAAVLGAQLPGADGTALRWTLRDEHGQVVCSYLATLHAGEWSAHVPQSYADALRDGRWRCDLAWA
jgi:hypothetical protein